MNDGFFHTNVYEWLFGGLRLGMERIIIPYVYKSYSRVNFGGKKKIRKQKYIDVR